jgi:uncharacterized protein (TIGR02147 family)
MTIFIVDIPIEKTYLYVKMERYMLPDIYKYLDYRHYLVDLFDSLKQSDADLSFRSFARMASSSSPNFLQLIRDRKLNISPAAVSVMAKSIKLSKKEELYFETIVAFDHAKTHEEKEKYFQRILRTREYGNIKELEKEKYQYWSRWYIPVVRQLVTTASSSNDPAWIASQIVPPITESQAKSAINLLLSLDLIRRDPATGRFIQTDSVVSTPSEVMSVAAMRYHKDTIGLARDALERFPQNERDIRSVTLGIPAEGYGVIKERLESFWKELMMYAQTQDHVEKVFQLNIQLFPLSKGSEK